MRREGVLVSCGLLLLASCGGDDDGAAGAGAAPTSTGRSEPIAIRTRIAIAAMAGAETIATGEVLAGSTLGGSPFCVGGAILDTHADPAEEPDALVARMISCRDGTVRMSLTPEVGAAQDPQDPTQMGSWTIVGGTGAFEGLVGSGKMETTYGPTEGAPARETLTGTVTR